MVHYPKMIKNINDKIPTRLNVGVMMFTGCFIAYMLRVNLSINILAMVEPQTLPLHLNSTTDFTTKPDVPDYGPRYNWTAKQESFLMGAYFWGYLVTSLPAGIMAERFGGRTVVGYALLLSSFLTALSPISADLGFIPFYIIRLAIGISGGVLYPAFHNLVAKWAPPTEKGKFVSSLLGGTFGTVITWPLAGILVETIGWIYAFYVPAIIGAVVTIFWFYLVADTPAVHPRIAQEEKEFIEKSLIGIQKNTKSFPPVWALSTSLPFWALLILHYGNLWGLYFLITAAPKYMSTVLGFQLSKAGFLSALPYLARMVAGFIFGSIGDFIRKKQIMSVTAVRKTFTIFSHVIPGLFLIGLGYIGMHPLICVAAITLSLGFNGCATVTNLQNSQDLAPNYAGTLYGIINFVGTTTGFITPVVVGYFTADGNTIEAWNKIFMIGATAYILPAIIFAIFGSGVVQPWNESKRKEVTVVATADNNAATV